ncbi:hypothetical protein HanPSC8_Chr09g0361451 [Helianthus annuus]|nr:hypothetical protein HanPSC8_Chr09g0361451 [Helianthus annuus]
MCLIGSSSYPGIQYIGRVSIGIIISMLIWRMIHILSHLWILFSHMGSGRPRFFFSMGFLFWVFEFFTTKH